MPLARLRMPFMQENAVEFRSVSVAFVARNETVDSDQGRNDEGVADCVLHKYVSKHGGEHRARKDHRAAGKMSESRVPSTSRDKPEHHHSTQNQRTDILVCPHG